MHPEYHVSWFLSLHKSPYRIRKYVAAFLSERSHGSAWVFWPFSLFFPLTTWYLWTFCQKIIFIWKIWSSVWKWWSWPMEPKMVIIFDNLMKFCLRILQMALPAVGWCMQNHSTRLGSICEHGEGWWVPEILGTVLISSQIRSSWSCWKSVDWVNLISPSSNASDTLSSAVSSWIVANRIPIKDEVPMVVWAITEHDIGSYVFL